jgi:hypothetical protein
MVGFQRSGVNTGTLLIAERRSRLAENRKPKA